MASAWVLSSFTPVQGVTSALIVVAVRACGARLRLGPTHVYRPGSRFDTVDVATVGGPKRRTRNQLRP